jgi:ParB-like chromosome segregation protein Spo0J
VFNRVDDLQALRISVAENLQREDLSAIEKVEAIVEIVDAKGLGLAQTMMAFSTDIVRLLSTGKCCNILLCGRTVFPISAMA